MRPPPVGLPAAFRAIPTEDMALRQWAGFSPLSGGAGRRASGAMTALRLLYHIHSRKANICSIVFKLFCRLSVRFRIALICLLFCKIPLKYRENYGIINICEIMIHALHG